MMSSNKSEIRKEMLRVRGEISPITLKKYNDEIFKKLISTEEYLKSKFIFTYVSYKNEVDTLEIIKDALNKGKRVCVPKVISRYGKMVAVEIRSLSDLKKGFQGILEPELTDDNNIVNEKEIDLAIIPGVAFDLKGGRIGYGGGFYDRFLPLLGDSCYKIALAYKFQILDNISMEQNDFLVKSIIFN